MNRHHFEVIDPYDDIPCICRNCRLEASGHDLPDTECPVVPVTIESLQAQIAARDALLDRVVTEVGRTITPELRADIDSVLAGTKTPASTMEPRTYADEPLSCIKAMGELVQDAKGIEISGNARKVGALLLCGAAVPDLVARIEELEGTL